MDGQISIFDYMHIPQPGDWLDEGSFTMGEPVSFNDLEPGMLVWANKSTESREWWKCLRVEKAFRDSHGDVSRFEMTPGPEYHSVLYMSAIATKPPHGENWYRRVI